jgi:DNA-binding Lrp family transcriptional regulator
VGMAGQVASAAAEIDGVQQAQPVTGPYDVIVRAEERSIDALGQLVVSRIQAINGVTRTLTCPEVHL